MLKTVSLEELEQVGGGNSFAPYGGFEAWKTSKRGAEYQDFLRLRSEGKVQFGRNGEWGRQYAGYFNNLTAGSRNPTNFPARGSREDNMPRPRTS